MRHFEKVSPLVVKSENCKLKIIVSLQIYLLVFLAAWLFPYHVYADITANDNWTIEIKDVNITTDTVKYKNKQQPNNQPIETYNKKNYATLLSLNVSSSIIDYGPLSPTNQVYRTSNLNISGTGTKNFIVIAYENHALSATGLNSFIPDSTCDNGSCTQVTSAPWTNILTYGFGYRCDNINSNNCPIDFKQLDYYKQFSDYSNNETEQVIMSGNYPASNHEIQITYKVNISKTQSEGSYSNEITYIAVPGY